jgi:hypothetical protein
MKRRTWQRACSRQIHEQRTKVNLMTYAVAVRLQRGLVFAADTRTNAGIDNVSQFRKLHFWRRIGDRVLVLLTPETWRSIDLLLYELDTLDVRRVRRIEENDDYYRKLSNQWAEASERRLPAWTSTKISTVAITPAVLVYYFQCKGVFRSLKSVGGTSNPSVFAALSQHPSTTIDGRLPRAH